MLSSRSRGGTQISFHVGNVQKNRGSTFSESTKPWMLWVQTVVKIRNTDYLENVKHIYGRKILYELLNTAVYMQRVAQEMAKAQINGVEKL